MLGSSPRTKLAEALLRLGDLNFSRADLAREAGLFRASTNRILEDFEAEGIVSKVSSGARPVYRANLDSPYLNLLARFTAALELVELTSPPSGRPIPVAHPVASDFSRSIANIKSSWDSGGGATIVGLGSQLHQTTPLSRSQVALLG